MKIESYNFGKRDYPFLKRDGNVYLRSSELRAVMHPYENRKFESILELGCGTGCQSKYLAAYADRVVATEFNENLLPNGSPENVEFLKMDAQDLSRFDDATFDLIFSSNLLEHLPDLDSCLQECMRVLTDDGLAVHAVPNIVWKSFNLLLYYPALTKSALQKLFKTAKRLLSAESSCGEKIAKDRVLDDNLQDASKRKAIHRVTPRPHGISASHIREFIEWREKVWIGKFEKHGFEVTRIIRLPFYYGYGLNFTAVHYLGNRLGLSSSTAYELTRKR